MRHIGLVTFGTTVGVLVPLFLYGGREQVAKLVAPDKSTISVGGASIEVTTDRGIVDAGKKVHVQLTATATTHAHPRLAVLVYEQEGMGQYRNELPPRLLDETEVTLDVRDGKPATRDVAFALPGNRASDMEGNWMFGHYTVLVMPPKDAERLHALGRKASSKNGWELANAVETAAEQPKPADDADDADAKPPAPPAVARLDVMTRTTKSPVSIHAPDSAKVGGEVAVEVRVHNPTRVAIDEVAVKLTSSPTAEVSSDRYRGISADQVDITPADATVAIGPGETKTVTFHVTAKTTGVLGLYASAMCGNSCVDGKAYEVDDAVIDAIDITGDSPIARQ